MRHHGVSGQLQSAPPALTREAAEWITAGEVLDGVQACSGRAGLAGRGPGAGHTEDANSKQPPPPRPQQQPCVNARWLSWPVCPAAGQAATRAFPPRCPHTARHPQKVEASRPDLAHLLTENCMFFNCTFTGAKGEAAQGCTTSSLCIFSLL